MTRALLALLLVACAPSRPAPAAADAAVAAIAVTVVWPGAAPAAVEREVVEPIEEALAALPGVRRLRSEAREGVAAVRVDLAADRFAAAAAVREALAGVQPRLPAEVEAPVVSVEGGAPIRRFVLAGPHPPRDLTQFARLVRHRVETQPGVAGVSLCGEREDVVEVAVDPARLLALGLPLSAVTSALGAAALDLPAGGGAVSVRIPPAHPGELGDLVLAAPGGAPLRLADVARISETIAAPECRAVAGGAEVVLGEVTAQLGAEPTAVGAKVDAALAAVVSELPPGVTLRLLPASAETLTVRAPSAPSAPAALLDAVAETTRDVPEAVARWRAAAPDRVEILGEILGEIAPVLREALAAPGRVLIGSGALEIAVLGEDAALLESTAARILAAAGGTHGVTAVLLDAASSRPTIDVRLDRARLADLGIPPSAVAQSLRAAQGGLDGAVLTFSGFRRRVIVRLGDALDPAALAGITILGPRGAVPLAQVATLEAGVAPAAIRRLDRRRQVSVLLEIAAGEAPRVIAALRARLGALDPRVVVLWPEP